ncbi:MAG: hypothetical protein ACOY16_07885 [Chloroflexota bacterium]
MVEPESHMEELSAWITRQNDDLWSTGSGSAEQAFGLAVWLGGLPILLVVLLLWVFKLVNLITAFIVLVFCALLLIGLTSLLAQQARVNAIRRKFKEICLPEIKKELNQSNITEYDFLLQAKAVLPDDAPMLKMLTEFPLNEKGDNTNG